MANSLSRRVSALESRLRQELASNPALTEAQIEDAVKRYSADLELCGGELPYLSSDEYRSMLEEMKPDMGQLFLHVGPEDLFL